MTSAPPPPTLEQLEGDAKRSYVRQMFTAIAPRYDFLNHVLSLNIDRRWRRRAVQRLGWQAAREGTYLDLCAGTLDLAVELARRPGFRGRVLGADFVVPMLRLGKAKAGRVWPVGADALELPFPDGCFDGCLIAFGVRNLVDLDRGLFEIARVVKPGGRAVILDFSTPRSWPVRFLYRFYFHRVLPLIGRVVSKHSTAYGYLPASVDAFTAPEDLARRLARAGFERVGVESLTFGIAALLYGVRS
ncbi:MAG: ubiquinone/menaquinone biosynthesis methyltransferase [Gemmatimonadetes bacterium]|nr:ubiquinone/menaquinone biosynthesis methyltransferase [Gemmatimonadota bacterium]